jgi:transcriptional regulator with XRE-family HTH domain
LLEFLNQNLTMKMRIGNRLLTERQDRKLNQAEMAELLGLASSTYSRIERNAGAVDMEQLVEFSQILNIPIQEFLPDTISMKSHNENGQVAFMVGNFYNYAEKETQNIVALKDKEIEFLKEKIKDLEEIIFLLKEKSE